MVKPLISVRNLHTAFGSYVVHDGLSVTVNKGDIFAIVGGSGSGKSTLLKSLVGLEKIQRGEVDVMGYNIRHMTHRQSSQYYSHIGFLFQEGALFGNLTVLENVALPLQRLANVPQNLARALAFTKLKMVGLGARSALLLPDQLSGGMRKRAALARSLALDPQLLFLDEPTAGLDPDAAEAFDKLRHIQG